MTQHLHTQVMAISTLDSAKSVLEKKHFLAAVR